MSIRRKGPAFAGRIALIVWALLALSGPSMAERLPIRTYTIADGLARDHINRIVQDSKGFIWFCTTEGLSRFDGYKFSSYGTGLGLADRLVYDFLETRSGAYWAATEKGLCRFIPDALPQATPEGPQPPQHRFDVYYPGDEAAARSITAICEDHAGAIWCGTFAGLFRLDQVNGEPVFSFVDIIEPAGQGDLLRIEAIMLDRGGSLWIIATSGLYRLRPDGTLERYTAEEGLPEGFSRALLEDHDGRIWVASDRGLYQLVPDPKPHRSIVYRHYTVKEGLATNGVRSLCQSWDGTLWAGGWGGLSALPPGQDEQRGRLRSYGEANGLSRSQIISICEDRDHNLWAGTDSDGAMRLAATRFVNYDQQDGLGARRVGSILRNLAGELCVITDPGFINKLARGRFNAVRLALPKGKSNWGWGWYQVIFQDSAGEWWMNTGQGLVRYPRLTSLEQMTHARPRAIYTTRDGLPTDDIFRLFEDSRRDIWISTVGDPKGVLARWDRATQTFHRYSPAEGIPESAPTAFCEDGAGNLWIGFYNGGLLRYRADRFIRFTMSDGVPPGMVRGLYLDHARRLWVATAEGGVARVDEPGAERPRFITYSTADDLSSNQASCVTEDRWGMIYIGTGRGLDRLDPCTGHMKHYTTADGLANSFVNVSFRDTDGSLWFGTLQGLSRLIPEPERPTPPPPILINGLRIAGTPYPVSELGAEEVNVPELGASQNHVQIDFLGLNLVIGETVRYQFKLEGADHDWNPATDQRTVNYPNLPPGAYRFLVRAVGSDGSPGDRAATVRFRIVPPIWQRWWFRIAALILIAMPIAAIARYRRQRTWAVREAEEALRRSREERLTELERVRTRIATDLHDDIGSTLSQIYLLSEVVRQRISPDDSEVAGPLTMITNASYEVVSSMSDIVWAINPRKDHLSDLIQRMRRFASDTFAAGDIAFRFSAPDTESDLRLGADVRREVFLIFKESVNNLVKHSGCTEAEIEFKLADNSLLLKVSDNGKGFDPFKDSEGHGLASMRERAKSIGGGLDLVSAEGGGTTVTLRTQVAQQVG